MAEEYISLADLPQNNSGIISYMNVGRRLEMRLAAMGIVNGKAIKKLSDLSEKSPVLAKVNDVRIAIGYKIAKEIIVKYETKKNKN